MFITTKKTHTIAPFDPQTTRDNLAKADAAIAFAEKIKNWPLLEEAIDAKIADQEEFVRWWAENVQRQGGLWSVFSGQWSIDSVERVTGITKQQVSLWRKWLEDKPKYRERMLLEARHADTLSRGEIVAGHEQPSALNEDGAASHPAGRPIGEG